MNPNEQDAGAETVHSASQSYAQRWLDKGEALFEDGKLHEALFAFERALSIDPKSSVAWYYKGETLLAIGKGTREERHELVLAVLSSSDEDEASLLAQMAWK